MIIHNVEQGTEEWHALRLGIPTASEFAKILTPTGKASAQAVRYRRDLIAEWATGKASGGYQSSWMARGHEVEIEARAFYSMLSLEPVEQVGFITRDDGMVGASPDGLVGQDGTLEIKSPCPGVQVGYLLEGRVPSEYWPQIQGQLFVAEREWADFLAYHPDLEELRIRVYRDEPYIEALSNALDKFVEAMLKERDLFTEKYLSKMEEPV